ncbi:signal peptide peptidase SppA [Flocculibacter collagenilyticus]|uniref:signal peptide peptidase SppA n=1 Tax=Flocculibacter collagenilyticus TaxID=2744479 RepID=UPI001F2B7300|nr:signal peptide peptidase SppA [Flocculibacter collagenilyticus]
MSDRPNIVVRFFQRIWKILNFSRRLFFNLIVLFIFIFIITSIFSDGDKEPLLDKSVLVLNINGDIVEQARFVDPIDAFINEAAGQKDQEPEIELHDLLYVIKKAKTDKRITALVLQLQNFRYAGFSKLQTVGDAIVDFKQSGKKVYAVGDGYQENQYYLAAHADEVILNPMGWVMIDGFSRDGLYFKDALEKFKVTPHIFRVGTYKSAVEPFIRNDMSEEAKEANRQWLNGLWNEYVTDVATLRGVEHEAYDQTLPAFLEKFEAANGDMAQFALNSGWVDSLKDRVAVSEYFMELFGKTEEGDTFPQTTYYQYADDVLPKHVFPNPMTEKVAVVIAKGTIVDGHKKAGEIGGDSTAELLRKARLDETIKAVVLRIDSPGGSAFASEVIRNEVIALKAAGKPVVASMSSVAASGGYWIASSTNEIWASSTTITGSIGVFGMFITLEKAMEYIGVNVDGVRTNELSDFSLLKPLNPKIGQIVQRSIEHTYNDFITMVAKDRNMTVEAVDKVAQGRVWTGKKAQELGLVDKLGDLDDAVKSAAELAGLERYDTWFVEQELSPKERLIKEMLGEASASFGSGSALQQSSTLRQLVKLIDDQTQQLQNFNDPKGNYIYCILCEAK